MFNPLPSEFVADSPYGPGGLLIDRILSVDVEESCVVAEMPVHPELPLTREQRAHPVFHPQHLNGGLMVHLTGMMGFAHAYFVLGLRHAEGWIGYGGRIYDAKFVSLGTMDERLRLECRATRVLRRKSQIFSRYDFRFYQGERLVYESDQAAMWMRVE